MAAGQRAADLVQAAARNSVAKGTCCSLETRCCCATKPCQSLERITAFAFLHSRQDNPCLTIVDVESRHAILKPHRFVGQLLGRRRHLTSRTSIGLRDVI